jgi:hypothetical protein
MRVTFPIDLSWQLRPMWSKLSQEEQLSAFNLDPDTLDDVVSIMVNKLAYKTFVKDIMDKYYKKNSVNKKDVFNSPDNPDHSDEDSDTDG